MARPRTRLDDSLDVAAAHGLGGLTGALLTGVFAAAAWGGVDGLLAGNPRQLLVQVAAVAACAAYSAGASWLLLRAVALVVPLRVADGDEGTGLDVPLHGVEAYGSGEGAILVMPSPAGGGERAAAGAGGRRAVSEVPA